MTQNQDMPVSNWNVPNVLTVIRIILVPVYIVVLFMGPHELSWRLAATAVFTVAMLTDLADGHIARKYNLITDFGKIWDPIADKALTGMAFIGLSILGELSWWVTIIILVREWGITILRWGIMKYGVMAANRGGKLKTFIQSLALILYLLWLPHLPEPIRYLAYALMAAAFILTVVTGLDYLREASRMRTEALARWDAEGHQGRP